MRRALRTAFLSLVTAAPAFASEAEPGNTNLLDPNVGLMFWTLLIFVVLLVVLSKFAFKPLLAAVEAREAALEQSIQQAQRDRAEAAALLEQQRAALAEARAESAKALADARALGEKARAEAIERAKAEATELLERTRREIGAEKERAIADLRREAIDLALAGAGKVIGQRLDGAADRAIVEQFLAGVTKTAG
ncbi:MAG: F0F1 ATP synthase subunit B [Gemmatimonadaceae bacterium]|jgi:F-type H+-transporting ATPase subunit b|nr:F0F1 ATP synthase subunit B [Gemmatimonadaceae bacterium]